MIRIPPRLQLLLADHLTDIDAIFQFDMMSQQYVVVVLNNEVEDLLRVVSDFQRVASPARLICMRTRELPYCSVPDRFDLETINLDWYMRHKEPIFKAHSFVIPGEAANSPNDRLAFLVEHLTHFIRNHVILRLLAAEEFAQLIHMLDHYVNLTVATALVAAGREPSALFFQCEDIHAHCWSETAAEALRAWLEMRQAIPSLHDSPRRLAYHAVWLFEVVIRELRPH